MSAANSAFQYAVFVAGVAGTIGGVYSFFRYGSYQATVKLQNDSILALETNNKILNAAVAEAKQSHLESVKEIGILEGKVRIYKDLQLDKMAEAMSDISSTNKEILLELRGRSNVPAKEHGDGLLVQVATKTSDNNDGGVQ